AASVDNVKDPVLEKLNINEFTAPLLFTFLHLGVPLKEALAYINSNKILELTKEYFLGDKHVAVKELGDLYQIAQSVSKLVSSLRVDSGVGPILHDVDKKLDDIISIQHN